jgi:apolipoprotein N-acyltransferase
VGVFLGGLFGFSYGFCGLCWIGVLSGQVWVFDGAFFYFLGSVSYGCSLWVSGFRVDGSCVYSRCT